MVSWLVALDIMVDFFSTYLIIQQGVFFVDFLMGPCFYGLFTVTVEVMKV